MNRAYSGNWVRPNHSFPKFPCWPHPTSEMDCSVSGRYPPDSAYYTKSPATQSIFSGEFPPSSQQSLTGAMNNMEFPNEQMSYMFPPRASQETQSFFVERPFAEQQIESSPEYHCEKCETPQIFKNKSEYQYVRLTFELRLAVANMVQQT